MPTYYNCMITYFACSYEQYFCLFVIEICRGGMVDLSNSVDVEGHEWGECYVGLGAGGGGNSD